MRTRMWGAVGGERENLSSTRLARAATLDWRCEISYLMSLM
jgi:hypothetical protein